MPKNNCDFKPILTVTRDGRVIGGDIFEILHRIEAKKLEESRKKEQDREINDKRNQI